jgi:hypothetical protein
MHGATVKIPFFLKNRDRAGYDIMRINMVQPDRPQITIWRMRFTTRITKTTNTHSEYVTFIAFPLQQWLGESA